MPLLPNQPFVEGADFTPELAYLAFNAPIFDDQPQYLGHRERIRDDELSDQAGSLKQRFDAVENSLRVSAGTGLIVTYTGGSVILPSGAIQAIAPGQLAVADNATSVIFADVDGVVKTGAVPAVRRLLMAFVVASGGAISVVEDLRNAAYRQVRPTAASVRSFGGSNDTDYVATQGETLTAGAYFYRNFNVPAGVSIFVDRYAKIVCSGEVNIAGAITVFPLAPGAQAQPYNLSSLGSTGQAPGFGLGTNGKRTPWGVQQHGSGGRQGELQNPLTTEAGWGFAGKAGDGGGAIVFEAAGKITITGSIFCDGTNATTGGSNANVPCLISGSGGGSGGLILLASLSNVTATGSAVLATKGGNGGSAFGQRLTVNQVGIGGSGGSGGYLVIMSPTHSTGPASIQQQAGDKGIPLNRAWSGNTMSIAGATLMLGGGVAGAYGGDSGFYTLSGSNITYTPAEPGQTVFRTFTPIS